MKNNAASFYKEATSAIDVDLRKYMLNVFAYMSFGLMLTAVIAYFVGTSTNLLSLFFSSGVPALCVVLIPFGISLYFSARIATISVTKAKALFVTFAVCFGLSLSSIFAVFPSFVVVYAFFVTSSMFLSMVIYGYVTEKDLTSWGAFLFMGLVGLIIAGIVNLFTRSSSGEMLISAAGVVIFTGLIAYDTQFIKSYYFGSDTQESGKKKAIFGALILYLDFINLFLYVLRLLATIAAKRR